MNTPPDTWQDSSSQGHGGRLSAMVDLAISAGDVTLKYFRTGGLKVEAKADDSPVTIADRSAEQWARAAIAEAFPDDAVVGEEFSDSEGTSRYRWIIDPIDGTKSFVCGVPLYSTLLALECDGQPLGGVIQIPALGETVAAVVGRGAWYRPGRDAAWEAARVSDKQTLEKSVLLTSQADLFARRGAGDAYADLERLCWVSRTWGDGYGYLLVATGRAELMVDAICNPWDVAAMLPIMKEAGGRFSDWRGNETCRGGEGIGTNGLIHDEVVGILGPHSPARHG
jgi:histidinol-phosphatase